MQPLSRNVTNNLRIHSGNVLASGASRFNRNNHQLLNDPTSSNNNSVNNRLIDPSIFEFNPHVNGRNFNSINININASNLTQPVQWINPSIARNSNDNIIDRTDQMMQFGDINTILMPPEIISTIQNRNISRGYQLQHDQTTNVSQQRHSPVTYTQLKSTSHIKSSILYNETNMNTFITIVLQYQLQQCYGLLSQLMTYNQRPATW
eukprot:127739_1